MVLHDKYLNLAKKVFSNCPAYKEFLKLNGIKNLSDFPSVFENLPLTSKENYIERFSIEERILRSKSLSDYYMVCTSSGSTGRPTIWPRDYELDKRAIEFNQYMYRELFNVDKIKSLVVITFGLGAWTAGMLTSRLCWEISKRNKISVVTPGLDKEVTLRVIRELAHHYDQLIITGYPPFIIELVEYGIKEKFDFKKANTKVHFTSARLLESQRNELARLVSRNNSRHDVLGFYASSEAGIIGVETPETVDILEYADKDSEFSRSLFGSPIPPSFVIYNPKVKFLEEKDGRIILTVDQPVPLIRYDTKDRGGILKGNYIRNLCKQFGYKFHESLLNKDFVYIHGRADSVRLLSNIYIEDIQFCLKKSKMSRKLSGYFKYGLKECGLRNVLKIIVYLNDNEKITSREKEEFIKELRENLILINPDFKMVSSGVNFSFDVSFEFNPQAEYKGGKFNYFL